MNKKELIEYKKKIKLTPLQRDVLMASMLGDGHLETLTDGRTWRFLVEQTTKNHKEYVMHLYEIFKPFVLQQPKEVERKIKEKVVGKNIKFRTITHQSLRFYGNLFYKKTGQPNAHKRKKTIPKFIHKYLNDRILAYWYMDDGARKGPSRFGKRLHTEGFTKDEVYLLCSALNKMGIQTTVNKQNRNEKTYYILNITAEGDRVLTKRIQPYIIPSMLYKL